MQHADGAADLEQLLADRGAQLMRAAVLLTGSQQDGEDLLQAALERLLRRGRIEGSTEGYLRRTLYNLAADGWRRQGTWRRKLPVIRASQSPAEPDLTAVVDLRDALMRILHTLPSQQRAVIAAYLRRHGRPGAANTDTEDGPLGKSLASSPSLHRFTETMVNYSDRTWSRGGSSPDSPEGGRPGRHVSSLTA